MQASDVLDVGLQFLVALLYALVAQAIAKRPVPGPAHIANTAFSTWWGALAFVSLGGVIGTILSLTGGWSFAALMTWTFLSFAIIMVALGALQYYLVYLYTGRQNAWRTIAALYIAFYFVTVYILFWAQPVGTEVEDGRMAVEYARDLEGHWIGPVYGIALVLPAFIGAIAYATLWFRTKEPMQRFRIGTVSGSIVVWFGASMGATLSGAGGSDTWTLVSRLIAVGAASANLLAYRTPARLVSWIESRAHREAK